jgi:hypothetical protein
MGGCVADDEDDDHLGVALFMAIYQLVRPRMDDDRSFAREGKVAPSVLSSVLSNDRNISVDRAAKVAKALRVAWALSVVRGKLSVRVWKERV